MAMELEEDGYNSYIETIREKEYPMLKGKDTILIVGT